MAANIYDWSLTDASNSNSDSGINWAEGQAPSTVNNSARAMMTRVKELLTDIGGSLSAGGTANGLTVTAESGFTAYANGQIISFKATADNTGAATLNVNGVGAKAIRKMDSTGDAALAAGDIQNTGMYIAQYSTALNGGAGAWLLVNPTLSAAVYALSSLTTTDNAIARYNGTAGALQNSGVIIDDSNNITGVVGLTLSGNVWQAANNSGIEIAGGNAINTGANLHLFGGTHASLANEGFLDATRTRIRSQDGSATYLDIGSTGLVIDTFIGSSDTQACFYAVSGTLFFRPNGRLDTTGQTTINTAGTMAVGGAITAAGNITATGSTMTATLFSGSGASLTNLDASALASGTVASARVSGSYTGITGTGALNAGSITSGFGNINIGASTFTTTGAASTGALSATTITASSGLTASAGGVTSNQNFSSSTANAVLATSGAGTVFLRPNGAGSATGQTTIASTGNMAVSADLSASAISGTTGTFSSTLQGTVVTATTAFRAAAGSAATPGISITGDTNTGFFGAAADEIGMSAGGTEIWRMTPTGFNVGRENVLSMAAAEYGISMATDGLLQVSRNAAVAMQVKRNGDGALMNIYNGTTQVGSISVTAAATAYNESSDGRRKENLRGFDSGGFLDALEVWHFDWKSGGSGYGVIAQDANQVFPHAISYDEQNDVWMADYSKFVPLLIAEVKALRGRVAALEA